MLRLAMSPKCLSEAGFRCRCEALGLLAAAESTQEKGALDPGVRGQIYPSSRQSFSLSCLKRALIVLRFHPDLGGVCNRLEQGGIEMQSEGE